MASWEPVDQVDIDPIDRDKRKEDVKWDDKFTRDLEIKLEKLKRFNTTLETSSDKDVEKDKLKKDTIVKSNI